MRWLLVPLAMFTVSCTPPAEFVRIVQISAVDKLQLADAWVYFAEEQGLKRVEKAAAMPMVQLVHTGVVTDFAVAPGHVYIASPTGIFHYPIAPNGELGQPSQISPENMLAVAADKSGVSWLNCTQLTHAAPDGLSQVTVRVQGPCAGTGTQLVIDSSTAYGMNGNGEWYASRSGGEVTSFANEPCKQIAAAAGWLYCSNGPQGLVRFSPHRKEIEQVLSGDVHAFAVGEARVYAGMGADLVASPRNSTQVDVVGTQAGISAISLDAANVYFVNTDKNLGLLLRTAQ